MRHLILAIFLAASAPFAQTNVAILGQGILTENRIVWGASASQSLYILSTKYMRDSGSARVNMDTSLASVGGAGACTQTITIRTGSAISPQLRCELSYRVRATDATEDGFDIYIASRYKNTPTTYDTGWVLPGKAYYLDSLRVNQTHTNPGATTSFTTRLVNFYPSGNEARICMRRASTGGPGSGDTIVFNNDWLRCW